MDDDDWFPLSELTDRLGGLVWVEQQLADLLAAWAQDEASPALAVAFATAAGHHRWHAEVLAGLLPTSPQLLEREPVRPPTPGWEATLAKLSDPQTSADSALRLRALLKLLGPWIDREIEVLRELARPVSDAPMIRWLRFVVLDHADDEHQLAELSDAFSSAPAQLGTHAFFAELEL